MAANKKSLKKKLNEKRLELLLHIIEEEVNNAYNDILLEREGGGSPVSRITDRSELPGLLFDPVINIGNAFKKFGAKAATTILRGIGSFIGGAIATLLPFNDPRTVDYINQKFHFWEQESLKFIDEQFKTETEHMRAGWETFKSDFWGIGFVASPFGAIAAAATAAKGVDAALSVANVVTGGKIGAILDKIGEEVKDPGDLESFLKNNTRDKEEAAKEKIRKNIFSTRCLAQLDQPNWIDPECLGFAKRNMFPIGQEGQQEYIDFVTGNLRSFNNARRDRYKVEYGKDPGYHYGAEEQDVINMLKHGGYISENYIHEAADKSSEKSTGLRAAIKAGMAGPPSKTSVAAKIEEFKKKFGEKPTNELLKKMAIDITKDPTAITLEQQWVNQNLPEVAVSTMNELNNALAAGNVPGVTPEQVEQYKAGGAGKAAKQAIVATMKNSKFPAKVSPAALQAVESSVDAAAKTLTVPTQPQQAAAPQAAPVQQPAPYTPPALPAAQTQAAPVAQQPKQ